MHSRKDRPHECSRQTRPAAGAHAPTLPRLPQELRARRAASADPGADARSGAVQRRNRHALRHLRAVYPARSGHRRASGPAGRAQRLDRGARRQRGLWRTRAQGARRRRQGCGAGGAARRRAQSRSRRAAAPAAPRARRRQCHADAPCPPRHRHPGDGVRRDPRERPARVDGRVPGRPGAGQPPARQSDGREHPRRDHARVRARRSGARTRHHPGQHQPPGARADGDRPQLPGEDQRQHRQLRRRFQHRGGGGEAGVGDPLGRRHGDGPVDRPEHPHHARLDHPQLAGADRHRADLPGAGEGRRRGGGPDLGDLPRHADRAGRAGRRLLHHSRRRASALHPAHGQAAHRHRLARRLHPRQVVHRPPPRELPVHALRGDLRGHEGVRRELLAGRRPAPRLAARTRTTRRSSPNCARSANSRSSRGSTTCRP